jgi:multidrug efflux pump
MGIAVFSGMLGVTFFGLLLTPLFYVLVRKLSRRPLTRAADERGVQTPGAGTPLLPQSGEVST